MLFFRFALHGLGPGFIETGIRGRCGGSFLGSTPGVLQQGEERHHKQENHSHNPECFYESHHGGVLLHESIQGGERFVSRSDGVRSVSAEVELHSAKKLESSCVTGCDMSDEMILMQLRAACEEGGHDRDTNAAADVPHEVENAGGIPHSFGLNASHGECHERDEEEAERDALQDLLPEDVPETGIKIEAGELKHCDGAQD